MASYSPVIHRALDFAAIAHREQLRKSPEAAIPYISHPANVGWILQRAGLPEHVIVAGILHDVLEDCPVTAAELTERFGEAVVALVQDCSEQDKSLPWEERKEHYIRHLRQAPADARAVSAADKLHNMSCMILSAEQGHDPFALMKRGREVQLSRFEAWYDALQDGWDHPLVQEVRSTLDRLKAITESPVPSTGDAPAVGEERAVRMGTAGQPESPTPTTGDAPAR